jgi:hypothetical protein
MLFKSIAIAAIIATFVGASPLPARLDPLAVIGKTIITPPETLFNAGNVNVGHELDDVENTIKGVLLLSL